MALRKGWQALSADYRNRLIRKGVTQAQYEKTKLGKGKTSLRAARGHAKGPSEKRRKTEPKAQVQAQGMNARQLLAAIKRIARRYDIDEQEMITAIRPGDRAAFMDGWFKSHVDYVKKMQQHHWSNQAYMRAGGSEIGRRRLDTLEREHPDMERAIGFYH